MDHARSAVSDAHLVPYRTFVLVWGALLALTALLVAVSMLRHDELSVPAMLTITPIKAALVFYFFMHLRYEGWLLKVMLLVALSALIVFLGLMYTDVSFR